MIPRHRYNETLSGEGGAFVEAAIIRQKFLQFFEENGHQVVPSSPIVPVGDPTLLFTAAGMVQFKDVFLGEDKRTYSRAVSVQKCMRAGGKHNDLDQVGRTARHQTFFEMLGNFSFGDYFKRDAIRLAWQFLTKELQISPDVLWITVFETDEEAYTLWQEVAGVSAERIVRMGIDDNFWSMGDTGPCGPCSEIFVDRGPSYACGPDCGLGRCDCDRVREIWNLVFMQYERNAEGALRPLPRPSIDTGMGLERIAAYLQGVDSNFDTDLLRPLIGVVERLSEQPYDSGPAGMPFRVIADHVRALTFLLTEGVSFSNEGRGYVMRRILRRAMRFGMDLGFQGPFLYRLVGEVGSIMGSAYPEVINGQRAVTDLIRQEEERFLLTLSAGLKVLNQKLEGLAHGDVLSGADAFLLYDTFGFPLDLTRDAALERGVGVDEEHFDHLMREQRERARHNRSLTVDLLPTLGPSEFVGYTHLAWENQDLADIYLDRDRVTRLEASQTGWLYFERTPFYPEGGGQVGDTGTIETATGLIDVSDTIKAGRSIWHLGTVREGYAVVSQTARLEVNPSHRQGAMRNHTATHLLHAALRRVLGDGVHQTGSLVAPERLRFDFSHNRPVTPEQIEEIENLVNGWVLQDIAVTIAFLGKEEALRAGALAFFGDKYGETVRVISVSGASQELCGGTHCERTGQIGLFAIVGESGVGGGSRRIEAVTGFNALNAFRRQRHTLESLMEYFPAMPPEQLASRVGALMDDVKHMQNKLLERARAERTQRGAALARQTHAVKDYRILVSEVEADSAEGLREVLDGVKTQVDGAVLASRHGDRVSMVVYFGEKVRAQGFKAGELVKPLSRIIEGGGGGRDDLAQAGGRLSRGVPALLREAREWFDKNLHGAG